MQSAVAPYFDLGRYSRPITCAAPQAQLWFDRGLIWCYGFNFEEAARCFERAVASDPGCAMAHWGIAYARGPFYNKPWEYFGEAEAREALAICHEATRRAEALAAEAMPVERAFIAAARVRFPVADCADRSQHSTWEEAFAVAMREVHRQHPSDIDVAAVFALALMTRRPWKLWDIRTGHAAKGADTHEARRVLEAGLAEAERQGLGMHPGLGHIYIHMMEMSPWPEKALSAADGLRDYSRDCGHLHHMPSHIYAQCGLYHDAILASEKAVAADARYVSPPGRSEFYILDRCHHLHLMAFAACMMGRFQPAIEASEAICHLLTPDIVRGIENPFLAHGMEAYAGHRLHVLVRFGRWQEIVADPLPADPALYPVTAAMARYAKGVAHAALGEVAAAEAEQQAFAEAVRQVPADRFFHNNPAADILEVGRAMLEGEIEYRTGSFTAAFDHLRRAAALDDALAYSEPWPWMHPPRHALGALLLEQGHVAEAAAAYRADLGLSDTVPRPKQNPGNVWSLHGLAECLERLGATADARIIAQQLAVARGRADVEITASCCCRTGGVAPVARCDCETPPRV